MKRYGVLACLALLCLGGCDHGSQKLPPVVSGFDDVILQSPEKVFEIKTGETLEAVWRRLGRAKVDEASSSAAYVYSLVPKGYVFLHAIGDRPSDWIDSVSVIWSSETKGELPPIEQFCSVEYEGSPHTASVPLSESERSRRHAPTPFVHLVGLTREEAAERIGIRPAELAGDVVRFRLKLRGYADVFLQPDGRIRGVEMSWKCWINDTGKPLPWSKAGDGDDINRTGAGTSEERR